jgi:hypothetical protein
MQLKNGLELVQTLSKNMEKHIKQSKGFTENIKPISLGQIW